MTNEMKDPARRPGDQPADKRRRLELRLRMPAFLSWFEAIAWIATAGADIGEPDVHPGFRWPRRLTPGAARPPVFVGEVDHAEALLISLAASGVLQVLGERADAQQAATNDAVVPDWEWSGVGGRPPKIIVSEQGATLIHEAMPADESRPPASPQAKESAPRPPGMRPVREWAGNAHSAAMRASVGLERHGSCRSWRWAGAPGVLQTGSSRVRLPLRAAR